MNKIILFLLILISISCSRQERSTTIPFTAGAASAPINPPAGAYIAGDRQNRKFTAVHDSLFVKAVVINDAHIFACLAKF